MPADAVRAEPAPHSPFGAGHPGERRRRVLVRGPASKTPGKGPFTFPAGYQTPWEKIQILVTSKMSPNLFVLHGSDALDPAHPDGSGGRVMVLFGPDGVLMVDTQNRQVAEKTLQAIRSFTNAPAPRTALSSRVRSK